jgi:O-6-methylguanine DNA methyltransferase
MISFAEKVFIAVRKIPRGETRSYQQIAKVIGRPKAYRAVANALAKNTDRDVPCHRVILSSGKLGGYNGLRGDKAELLKKERIL